MNVERLDHTAIVVRDLDEALGRYQRLFGARCTDRTTIPDQEIEMAFLSFGDTLLELIQPIDNVSGVARFLERRGEGLHHIAFAVDDIHHELQRLHSQGIELIDERPRRGVHGQIAFIHPRSTGGVLVELVQHDTSG